MTGCSQPDVVLGPAATTLDEFFEQIRELYALGHSGRIHQLLEATDAAVLVRAEILREAPPRFLAVTGYDIDLPGLSRDEQVAVYRRKWDCVFPDYGHDAQLGWGREPIDARAAEAFAAKYNAQLYLAFADELNEQN